MFNCWLRPFVAFQQLLGAQLCPLEGVEPAGVLPAPDRIPVNDCTGEALLLGKEISRGFLFQEFPFCKFNEKITFLEK